MGRSSVPDWKQMGKYTVVWVVVFGGMALWCLLDIVYSHRPRRPRPPTTHTRPPYTKPPYIEPSKRAAPRSYTRRRSSTSTAPRPETRKRKKCRKCNYTHLRPKTKELKGKK